MTIRKDIYADQSSAASSSATSSSLPITTQPQPLLPYLPELVIEALLALGNLCFNMRDLDKSLTHYENAIDISRATLVEIVANGTELSVAESDEQRLKIELLMSHVLLDMCICLCGHTR